MVVGLGNPGRRYARTRHNVGFRVVEALCERWQAGSARKLFGGELAEARLGPAARRVMLLRPMMYMNRSGQAVRDVAGYHRIDLADVLVVLDDMALEPGRLRARASGSAGGHKGLGDVLSAVGTDEVARLRIGIGQPPEFMDATDYVLAPFGEAERDVMERAIALATEAVEDWLAEGTAYVMNKYNRAP